VVVTYLGMFLVAAHAAGVHATPQQVVPLALVVLLAAAIPLNIAGWGAREGVAAWVFAAAGFGASTGTAVATAFGVLTVVATLPGLVVLVAGARRRASGADPEPTTTAVGAARAEGRTDG